MSSTSDVAVFYSPSLTFSLSYDAAFILSPPFLHLFFPTPFLIISYLDNCISILGLPAFISLSSIPVKWGLLLFSHLVVSSSLRPHGLQHARLPCPSLSPGVCSDSWGANWVSESVMLSNHLILCHPLLTLHSVVPSIRVFSNELALYIRWPKYLSSSFSISPSSEYSGLISFRIDCLISLQSKGISRVFLAP